MGLADKCHLHIPYKRWAFGENPNPSQEENNWNTLERWADNLLKRCMPSGGACIYSGSVDGLSNNHGDFGGEVQFNNLGVYTLHVQANVYGSLGPASGGIWGSVSVPNFRQSHSMLWGVESGEERSYNLTASDDQMPAGLQTIDINGFTTSNTDISVYYTIITTACGEGTQFFGVA